MIALDVNSKKKLHVSADKIRTLDVSTGNHQLAQFPPHEQYPPEEAWEDDKHYAEPRQA
jgi:hypothetical protein